MLNNKKVFPYLLLVGQLTAILSTCLMFLYGNAWQWAITLGVYCCMMISVTIGYHRLASHRAFNCPPWLRNVLLFFAGIPFYGPAMVWVANHREHHRYSDTDKDPHSPHFKGWFRSYFLQVLSPIHLKYVRDLLKQEAYRKQTKYYWHMIAAYAGILYLIDPFAVVYAYLAPAGFSKLIGSFVFSYSHRNRVANDDFWLGMLTFGEGFHKLHHEKAAIHRWHKYDVGGMLIETIDNTKKV
ncbi:fatty acid desaturase [bacterium]|nr:fatty acid desaturase [bacterium]